MIDFEELYSKRIKDKKQNIRSIKDKKTRDNENEVIDSISNYAKFNTIKTHEVEINNTNKTY